MTWQWWRRDFKAQEYRRTVRRAIPADHKNKSVYLDLRVGGWLMMWEGHRTPQLRAPPPHSALRHEELL